MKIIVIGSGPDALACAALLAKKGHSLTVLAEKAVGGIGRADEFHAGFTSPGLLHDLRRLRPRLLSSLGIDSQTLPSRAAIHGERVVLLDSEDETLDESERKGLGQLRSTLSALRPVIENFVNKPPVDIIGIENENKLGLFFRALGIRRLGRDKMLEMLRIPTMAIRDLLDECLEDPVLKAGLAFPAVSATRNGPLAPGSAANFLLSECSAHTNGFPGTLSTLCEQLAARCEEAGVELLGDSPVSSVRSDGDRANGVFLQSGEVLGCDALISALDPRRTICELLPRGAAQSSTLERMENYRCRGSAAVLELAVDGELSFPGAASSSRHALVSQSLLDLERAFDGIKYNEIPSKLALDVLLAPEHAPEGKTVVSVLIHAVPALGWEESMRNELVKRTLAELSSILPSLGDAVLGHRLLCPPDLEEDYGLSGGHLWGGEHGLDQLLVRPIPECVAYQTPLPGLWLTGGGNHPFGFVSGASALHCSDAVAGAKR